MKKIFFITLFVLFFFNVYGQTYENVERTSSVGIVPVLSDSNERTDGYYLPSLLAANRKGYGYIDCNFTKGGLILPFLDRILVFSLLYENGNTRGIYDIKSIMKELRPNGPDVPSTNHLMGFGFGANVSKSIALGLNFRYLLGRLLDEDGSTSKKWKSDTDRIELNPSFTLRSGSLFVDFGIDIAFQWLTEKMDNGSFNKETSYTGNVEFGFFGRTGFAITKYSNLVFSTGFGVIPISEDTFLNVSGNETKSGQISFNKYFWNFKIGSIITPETWIKIHPAVVMSLDYDDYELLQVASNLQTSKTNKKDYIFKITLLLGMDITPVEWFSIRAGVLKDFNAVDKKETTITVTDEDYSINEKFGAYFGPAFMWKGFSFVSTINLDFFTKGPHVITGNKMTSNWAYVATVEYQW